MERLILFSLIVAWPIAIIYTLATIVSFYAGTHYDGSIEEIQDSLKGFRRTYTPMRPMIIALIAWAWIITNFII